MVPVEITRENPMSVLGYIIPVQDLVGGVRFSRSSVVCGGDVDWAFVAVCPLTLKENSHNIFSRG